MHARRSSDTRALPLTEAVGGRNELSGRHLVPLHDTITRSIEGDDEYQISRWLHPHVPVPIMSLLILSLMRRPYTDAYITFSNMYISRCIRTHHGLSLLSASLVQREVPTRPLGAKPGLPSRSVV